MFLRYKLFGYLILSMIFGFIFISFSNADNVLDNYVEWEVIVKYKESFAQKISTLSINKTIDRHSLHLFKSKGKSTEDLIVEFQNNPDVEYVEPNYIYTLFTNDTYYDSLWWLEAWNDNDIDWNDAIDLVWTGFLDNLSVANPGSVIAVVDNGVDSVHTDLQNQMWSSDNCKDEDWNDIGTCNWWYNFVDNIKWSIPALHYHGTHVAGILWAEGWNTQWVVGVNPWIKIMWLKVWNYEDLNLYSIYSAIDFARQNGIKIINASFWWKTYSQWLRDVIQYFTEAGWIFVTAAWNGDQYTNNWWLWDDHDAWYHIFPCDYSLSGIVCVAATDNNDAITSFSDYGIVSVDVAAPWSNIYSTMPSNSYWYLNGTSMATPYVAWLISLAWSYKPDLTSMEVISHLFGTVEKLPSLSWKIYTEWKINAYNLMNSLSFSDIELISPWSGEIVRWKLSLNWATDTWNYISWYNYFVYDDSSFSSLVVSWFTMDTWVDLVLDKWVYYWWVQAINNFGIKGDITTGVFYYAGLSAICDSIISGVFVWWNPDNSMFVENLNSQHFGIIFDSQVFSSWYSWYQQISQINIYYSTWNWLNLFATWLSPLDFSGNIVDMSWQDFWAYFSGDIAYIQTYDYLNNIVLWSLLPYISWLSLSLGLVDVDGYEVISEAYPISLVSEFLLDPKSLTILQDRTNELSINLTLRYPDDMSYVLFGSWLDMSWAIWNTWVNQTGFVGTVFWYKNIDAVLSTGDWNKELSIIYYRSGFVSEVYTSSIVLDTINLWATIVYSTTWNTNQDVIATLIMNESGVVTNNSWNLVYTFINNWEFTFEYEDLVGNTGIFTADVDWIDKTKPTAIIEYISWTNATTGNVLVTITWFSESITWLNATGHLFTENWNFVFEYEDLVWNTWETIAIVNWIDRNPPIILWITNSSTYTTSVYLDNVTDTAWVKTVLLDGVLLPGWTNIKVDTVWDHTLFVEDILWNNSSITFTIKKKTSGGWWWWGVIVFGTDEDEEIPITWEITGEIVDNIITNNWTYILSWNIFQSPYSDELNDAYVYAYSQNITTKNSVVEANMEWFLIRSHMSKMMSNFAINVLWRKPDLTKLCQFSDTENQSEEMKSYIMLSCQLWLMGIGTEKFSPESEVTRAQFGTVLSRAIWWDKFNSSIWEYYEKHLAALKAAGIMTKIENPWLQELRWRVMLMLMRVDEKY